MAAEKMIQRVINTAKKMTDSPLPSLDRLYSSHSLKKAHTFKNTCAIIALNIAKNRCEINLFVIFVELFSALDVFESKAHCTYNDNKDIQFS